MKIHVGCVHLHPFGEGTFGSEIIVHCLIVTVVSVADNSVVRTEKCAGAMQSVYLPSTRFVRL